MSAVRTRTRSAASATKRAAAGMLVALALGAAGCSVIVGLSSEDFDLGEDGDAGAGGDASLGADSGAAQDATTHSTPDGVDASADGDADAGVPRCTNPTGVGWELDCAFFEGGILSLPVAAPSRPPVVILSAYDSEQILIGGAFADAGGSYFFDVVTETASILTDHGVIATQSGPVDMASAPKMMTNLGIPTGVFFSNATSDAGVGGLEVTVAFDTDGNAIHSFVFASSNEPLSAFQLASFDADNFSILTLANVGVFGSQHPALVNVPITLPPEPAMAATIVDLDAAPSAAGAISATVGLTGGFIGTSNTEGTAGVLYELSADSVNGGIPMSATPLPLFVPTGGIATVGSDLGAGGVVMAGYQTSNGNGQTTTIGLTGEFAKPPQVQMTPAQGSSVLGQKAVRLVHGAIDSDYYAVGVSDQDALTITRFRIDPAGNTVSVAPTLPDGGTFLLQFPKNTDLGSALFYQGDICVSLFVESTNRAEIACFVDPELTFVPNADAGTVDGGDDASDASGD